MVMNRLVGLTLVALIAFSGLLPYIGQGIGLARESIPVDVATRVIGLVEARINMLLNLAEENGVTIPENLVDRVEEARGLISQAYEIVDDDPREAIKLSIRAAVVFAPVARYIVRNVPVEAFMEVRAPGLIKAIEVRLRAVYRLNETINWLEEHGINVPDDIKEMVVEARELLEDALSMIESGEYDPSQVARMVAEASRLIGIATGRLNRDLRMEWRMATIMVGVTHSIIVKLERIAISINKTIEAIVEDGDLEEVKVGISITLNHTLRLAEFIDRIIESGRIQDKEVRIALELARDTLIEVAGSLEIALDALDDGDTTIAVSALESALEKLDTLIDELLRYAPEFIGRVKSLRRIMPTLREKFMSSIVDMMKNRVARGMLMIGMVKAGLDRVLEAYEDGRISKDVFLNILEHLEEMLLRMKERLESMPRPPRRLLDIIDGLLSDIAELRSMVEE